jgi:DNA-binding transcriptional LysR family regulator
MAELRWDDVRLFLALGRARTVGEAGRALGVDASTASRRLAALEDAVGAALFDRSKTGIRATKAAEDLLPVAEEIEAMMARFSSAAAGLEREVAGLVRITCPPDVAEVVVAPLLAELLRRHPSLRVELDPGESLRDLSRREADIALRTVRPRRGDLVVTRVLEVGWVLAGCPELVTALGKLRAWSDAPWVGWGERFGHTPPARWLEKHAAGLEPAVRSDSLRVQLAAVAAGAGVALVPAPSVEAYGLAAVKLAPALRDAATEWPTAPLYLVTHQALFAVPRVKVVWNLLRDRLAQER